MRTLFFVTMSVFALNANADTRCGRISYSTFENGSTTVNLFTDSKVYNVYSTNRDIDNQLLHLSTRKRNVCLDGTIDEGRLEINAQSFVAQ